MGDIQFALRRATECGIDVDSLLIAAGDTLFRADFDLARVTTRFAELVALHSGSSSSSSTAPFGLVLTYELSDHNEVSKRGRSRRCVRSRSNRHCSLFARIE